MRSNRINSGHAMRVTFCAFDRPDYISGPNVWLQRALPELQARGIEPTVLFMVLGSGEPQDCNTLRSLRRHGIECSAIAWPMNTQQEIRWVLESLAHNPPDVFVPNLVVSAYYAARWMREAGIPTIGVLHSDQSFYRGLVDEFALGLPSYRLSAMVCVSRFLEQTLQQQNIGEMVVRWIPSGAPIANEMAQAPTDRLRFVYVGRLIEHAKRISELTHAFCRTVREVPGTEAIIVGDGPDRNSVEKIVTEEGSGLPVSFIGSLDSERVQEFLLTCHVVVLLSDYEGLPISLMEAMACGLPPICLRTRSGIPELVEHEATGLLVDDRGDSFVAAVRRLRNETGLWQKLSLGARDKIEREYSVQVSAALWDDLIHELHTKVARHTPVRVPRRLRLPATNPCLAREDLRKLATISLVRQKALGLMGDLRQRALRRLT